MEHFHQGLGEVHLDVLKSLFILPDPNILEDLNINASAAAIRQSLLARLPAAVRHDAMQYFNKIYIDMATWKSSGSSTDHHLMRELQHAIWVERKLSISYQKRNSECAVRRISPLGLVAKGSSWYVVALNEQGEFRNFKVSRIVDAQIEDEQFATLLNFSLSQYWEESKSEFEKTLPVIEVNVQAHRSILPRLSYSSKFISRIELSQASNASADLKNAEQELVLVTLQFNSEQEAIEYVLGFGGMMKLLQPEHLVPIIVEQANKVISQYDEA